MITIRSLLLRFLRPRLLNLTFAIVVLAAAAAGVAAAPCDSASQGADQPATTYYLRPTTYYGIG